MKKERDKYKEQKGGFDTFTEEYLTPKNVMLSIGVASLAGLATYSTVRALKNEKLINRVKKELNFDNLKKNISSTYDGFGFGKKKDKNLKSVERGPLKKNIKSTAKAKR